MKLLPKIRLSLVLTAVVPLLVFAVIAYFTIQRTLTQSAQDRLALDANAYVNTVTGMVELATDEVVSWSKLETLQAVFTGEDLDLRMGLLLRSLSESNHFLEIRCLDTKRQVVAASDFYVVGETMAESAEVSGALSGITQISDVDRFGDTEYAVTIAAPIYAAFDEETVVGCVIAWYDWGNVLNLTARLNKSYGLDEESLELMDRDGRIIATMHKGHMLTRQLFEPGEGLLANESGTATTAHGFATRARVVMEEDTALAAARQMTNTVLGVGLVSALVVIALSLVLARIISSPIVELSGVAREIAGGNLDVRPVHQSTDEIGQLAVDLDTMRRNLKNQIETLDSTVLDRTRELEETIRRLQSEMEERAAAETKVDLQQQQLVQADKMASLGILVSGVAHEINNPNGLIALNIPIIREAWERARPVLNEYAEEHGDFSMGTMSYSELCGQMDELFDQMNKSSQRIQSIVSDLKVFAQKRTDTDFEEVDVAALVKSASTLVGKYISERTDHLSFDVADGLPPVRGIFQRLEQVLVNLLLNAADALESPEAAIIVTARFSEASNHVEIRVTDEGCGIDKQDLGHVTDPFYTTKRERGGTGLGLSVSSGIMQEHGGALIFESHAGRGTEATMKLPAAGNRKS